MSELKLLDCVENGAGTCRNELLFEAMQRSCNGFKEKNRILAEELENLRAAKGIDEIERLRAGIERAEARAEAAESALISMVNQYCYRPLDANKEPSVDIYQHDFMSAGEEAFAYLVEHGLAKWTDESHYAILINSKTSLSVKSDD
jgi:hypothetical protein